MAVREPFAYGAARRYPLGADPHDAGAKLISDELVWVDPPGRPSTPEGDEAIGYDALVLALGADHPRYTHALTIDDRRMDDTLHGLIQDIEGDYLHTLAFVSPGRMAWPLPLYELALMTAGRAYDMGVELSITIVTPEDAPWRSSVGPRATRQGAVGQAKSRRSPRPTRRFPTRRGGDQPGRPSPGG